MRTTLPAAVAALAAVLLAVPAHGAQRLRHRHVTHQAPAGRPPAQIACTVLGCMPIPAACTPVAGRTPGGIPTGFDVIVCPPGTWPLK